MEVFRYYGISVILLPAIVIGVNFSISKKKVLLGSTGRLTMRCGVTETDVKSIYLIQIRRIKSTTLSGTNSDDWQTLALMQISTNESPTMDGDISASTKDYVAEGSWDSTTPSNTYLSLSMNMEKLVCADARYYRCEFNYRSTSSGTSNIEKNATFSAYVMPKVTSLIVRRNGFIVQGLSSTDTAAVEVGDQLELTCNANVGILQGTLIRWHRTSETASTNEFIGYQPPQGTYDDGKSISDNLCGYTREAMIKYNATAADANRANNLAFECYVTVSGDPYGNSSENNPKFYAYVRIESSNASNDGAIIGGVIGGILAVALIVVLTWFLWLRRRGDGENRPDKQVQHQRRESRETGLSDLASTPNIYQQLHNRTEDTECTMAYDSLHCPEKQNQQQRKESRDAGLSDLSNTPNDYEQLQDRTDKEISMAYDSLHASSSVGQSSQSYYENLKQGAEDSSAGMQPRR